MARIVVIGFGAHQLARATAALAWLTHEDAGADDQPVLATRDPRGRLHFKSHADVRSAAADQGGPFGLMSDAAGLLFLGPMMLPVGVLVMGHAWFDAWTGYETHRSAGFAGHLG